ncbi:MAG: DNA polymerase III subunit gamma/tau, partial [Verrucomicrobia bacterium]|nr:DNA polymerase III subunit gamma/tau [Verrucomicrobiota bacterium]
MSYQVIARKYRPQRFADVVGQEHVTQTLAHAIEQNRIAHAYLFCGPRGTGKTTIARIFAKCLNATGGPRVDFDDSDIRVQEITEGRSIDVLEIDGASNNGVEQVRELRETCKYAPASSKFKIYIIDEVHMLSPAAFNALLKTLEEPPAHVKFMFATTDPEKVLPTILSRCQRFDLRRIPTALIVKHLTHIAKLEKVTIDEAALFAIARGAEGGMRDAESALDQLISFCGDRIEESDVLSMFGLTAQGQILELSRAVLAGEVAA